MQWNNTAVKEEQTDTWWGSQYYVEQKKPDINGSTLQPQL